MVHSEDLDAHLISVEEDMEYWRTKRMEPRVFRLLRKGEMSFADIITSAGGAGKHLPTPPVNGGATQEERVAALELRLGEFIRGIEVANSVIGTNVLNEEGRDEAGVYDGSFKFGHRKVDGSSTDDRISELGRYLEEEMLLLGCILEVLVRKGWVTDAKLEEMLRASNPPRYENGARIVARAWLDPAFKAKLMDDAKGTLRELGFALNRTPKLVVLEDTDSVHHVIVCTLCSCYPYELLGNPPWWYKHDSYKEAIVREPRKTLGEMFKLSVPGETEVRVVDSTSDVRYMVMPKRPEGSDGLREEELAKLVTQDSLIGVGETIKPAVAEAR
ncbi:MAG: nitrile hydratase subunit alpha [Nitrososphaerales archaeon]